MIFSRRENGRRLLAVWHKIKIQILLEKLMCKQSLLFSVYHVSEAMRNGQKKTFQL